MITVQDENDFFCSRSTQPHLRRQRAECRFSKKLFFQLHMAMQTLIRSECACLRLELPASALRGSDLSVDRLGANGLRLWLGDW